MAVFDLILIGLAVTVEPIPVTGFIIVLSSERGTRKGASYIAGWMLSLVVVVAATVAVTGGRPPRPATTPSTVVLVIKIAFGVALLVLALHRRRQTGRPRKPATWMARVDGMSVWAAAPLGLLLQPWVLVGAGAATVSQLHISTLQSYLLLALFCVLCTSSILIMELYAVRSPEAARQRMDGLRRWMDDHRDQVIVVLALIVGFWLIGDNLYLVAS
jgi:hypothetical protein